MPAPISRPRPKLSLCMIVRDSADTLAACLTSIRPIVDEMIVVDTGSNDETPQVARQLGAMVFHFPWVDSFSAARNESLRLATGEWLFWMDADDVIDEKNGRGLRELALGSRDPRVLGYVVQVHCPDSRSDGDSTLVDHVKLFRNHPAIRFEHRIHEQVLMPIRRLGGEIAWTDLFVVHANADQTPAGRQRKYQRDLRLLELDLQDHPDHPFVLFNFGMTYNDMGEHSRAVSWLERSVAVSNGAESHLRKTYALLVHSQAEIGQTQQAFETCQKGLQLFPQDAELLFRYGMLLHQYGRLEESTSAYRKVICNGDERHFSSRCQAITGYKARHNLALVQKDMGKYWHSELLWREILDDRPAYRAGWRGLTETLLLQRRLAAADVVVEQMLSDPKLRGDGLMAQAEIAFGRGEAPRATELVEQVAREFPDDLDLLRARCRVLFECKSWENAERSLTELTVRNPDDGAAWHNLGMARYRQGNHRKAIAALAESLRIRPDSVATRDLLEEVISKMNSAADSNLSPCHSRRDFDPEHMVYLCAHPKVHVQDNLVTADVCRSCTRWQEPPPAKFREFPAGKYLVRQGPCYYLGQQTGLRDCPSCRGSVKIKVFACLHPDHKTTTIAECARCSDYQPKGTESSESTNKSI